MTPYQTVLTDLLKSTSSIGKKFVIYCPLLCSTHKNDEKCYCILVVNMKDKGVDGMIVLQ
jgi:hypothetical protein